MHLSYFQKLAVITQFPIVLAMLSLGTIYGASFVARRKFRDLSEFEIWKENAAANLAYGLLLLLYLSLTTSSTYTFQYFNCDKFNQGDNEDNLVILAIDPTIKCEAKGAYGAWRLYVALMITLWPIGMPLCVAVLLWANRRKLNPEFVKELSDGDDNVARTELRLDDCFSREQRRYASIVKDAWKIEERNKDPTLKWLEFVYEEYL